MQEKVNMIQVCRYRGCGIVYGEKEPVSDEQETHGLCPEHFAISLKELRAKREKRMAMPEKGKNRTLRLCSH